MLPNTPQWLEDAVFYEIYPQSFQDTNNDGIGDLQGIIQRLDYIKELGANALWINPCFDSPFKDAGYDVRDYKKIAPRYGTNKDAEELFEEAHKRGIRVLFDLVPGHTSEEHEWFVQSAKAEKTPYDNRFIWTSNAFEGSDMPFIGGESERDGAYIINFFKCQPALNYGFAARDEQKPWQVSTNSLAANATKDAMVEIMEYWLAKGCDGFRVDMANSLVKKDDGHKSATISAWQYMFNKVKQTYPEAVFVAEWGAPSESFEAGFDMDFYLDWHWEGDGNGYHQLTRLSSNALSTNDDRSYFASHSNTSIQAFLKDYLPQYQSAVEYHAQFSLITCNHDTPRMAPRLNKAERAIALGMLLTMPGVPYIFYGDEIGMRYRDLPTVEGGYARTGSRSPMQWNNSINAGFTGEKVPADQLYIPIDTAQDAPNVQSQIEDEHSQWHWVQSVLQLRHKITALQASSEFVVLSAPEQGRNFAYARLDNENKNGVIVVLNPSLAQESVSINALLENLPQDWRSQNLEQLNNAKLLEFGSVSTQGEQLNIGAQSFAVFSLQKL